MKSSWLLLTICIISGCATKVVSIYNNDVRTKAAKTYLIRTSQNKASISPEKQKLDGQLQEIIAASLETKGLKPSSIPDLYISYKINIYSSSESNNNSYNRNRYNYMNPYSFNNSTSSYKEGILIIDVKNGKSQLVWQGSKTLKLRSRQSVNETLKEICQEIIEAYNPSH